MKQHKIAIFFVIFLIFTLAATTFLAIFAGPILIGFLVSYVLNPLFVYLERKGISRNVSSIISIILLILLTSTAVWIVLPIVIAQIQSIIARLPDFRDFILQNVFPEIQTFFSQLYGQSLDRWSLHANLPINYEKISTALIKSIGESTRFLLLSVLFIIATPIFMFMFMKHLPHFYSLIVSLVPQSIRPAFIEFFKEVDFKLRAVFRGQVLVIFILCFIYPIAFLISGLPTAIAVGVLVALARFISGLDTIVAVSLGSIVLIINGSSYQTIFASIFAFICVQCLDIFVINPRVMGKFSGLHPLLILVSVILFGYWFGIYGVLIAIPAVTILKVALRRTMDTYKKTAFFTE